MNAFAADVLIQLRIRPVEAKLLALALDPAAQGGEIVTSAAKLINCLRSRGVSTGEVFRASPNPASSAADSELARAKAMRMPFGKHRHKFLCDVPLAYLRWAKDNCKNMSPNLRDAIAVILEGD
jgi:Putative quorum-sensing-regulated virulence factor